MTHTVDITPAIIDSLYEEGLTLADEARAAFHLSGIETEHGHGTRPAHCAETRVALSCEALRTTTRMMHAIAWLLNHKAYFAGELSEFQLRRAGRLPPPQPRTEPAELAQFDPDVVELVIRSSMFYARLLRLDQAWRNHFAMEPSAVQRLRTRLNASFEMRA